MPQQHVCNKRQQLTHRKMDLVLFAKLDQGGKASSESAAVGLALESAAVLPYRTGLTAISARTSVTVIPTGMFGDRVYDGTDHQRRWCLAQVSEVKPHARIWIFAGD